MDSYAKLVYAPATIITTTKNAQIKTPFMIIQVSQVRQIPWNYNCVFILCIHIYIYICIIHVWCIGSWIYIVSSHTPIIIHIHIHIYIYTHIYIYMYIYIWLYIYIFIYTSYIPHIYMIYHIYIYIYHPWIFGKCVELRHGAAPRRRWEKDPCCNWVKRQEQCCGPRQVEARCRGAAALPGMGGGGGWDNFPPGNHGKSPFFNGKNTRKLRFHGFQVCDGRILG